VPGTSNHILFGGCPYLSNDDVREADPNFYIFEVGNLTWSNLKFVGSIPCARSLHTMAFFQEKMLVIFGGMKVITMTTGESAQDDEQITVLGDIHFLDV
jgi:hypothetical protein